ncbi:MULTISPECIES: creatininase family protein [unclassified Curtobacterium]|uniref:creatininase family protein n=1 Tax=unclassified Curtobacterium TaxID=257496 RepID=UPI000DA8C987|nr:MULTISPECIES: creatininase family protein [unclassified Curtobacterium]PZE29734.1 creatininase family protein [Curtobacterium sp. MCBD17_028]PZE75847.1 creatininase family protein [Curtobacterium sp. MCBD17_019]PZF60785.1 creatininase family protein [Curtobacterium sp. MCBD17_034]PZF66499.1 creatininase family protein [Curtobacterium sp. MCBD17_013]PZM40134.1 creatininase family protein [Curtobacterium sp. MCBD17_031]
MSTRKLAELPGPDVAARFGPDTIVVQPTGAVEHHGPHLPLVTDFLLADHIGGAAVERAADEGLDVWQLPTLAFTKSDEHSWAPGTVWLDADTMFDTVVQIGRAVALMGAGTLVFANGHGGNTALLQVALREIRRRTGLKTFLMPTLARVPGPDGEDADERGLGIHGGAAETSMILHLRPDLVDLARADRWVPDHIADFERIAFNGGPVSFGWLSNDFGTPGVVGDASRASAEYGKLLWDVSLDQAVASLHEIARFDPAVPR